MRSIPFAFLGMTAIVFTWGPVVALTEPNNQPTPALAAAPMPRWLRSLPHEGAMQYRYRGQTVYNVPPGCGDLPGTLYDMAGRVLCHPDGGFTGLGDRRCPDVAAPRSAGRPVW